MVIDSPNLPFTSNKRVVSEPYNKISEESHSIESPP